MSDPLSIAKERLDLPALFREMGVRLREGRTHAGHPYYTGRCPFHDDKEPSLSIVRYPDGWGWKCHAGCGQGTVVDFLMVRDGTGRAEAVRKALEMAGLAEEASKIATRIRIGEKKPVMRPEPPETDAGPDAEAQKRLDALMGRFHEARMRLEEQQDPPPLLARYGISLEVASSAGLGLEDDGGLLIPLYGMWGGLLNIKKRNPEGRKPRYYYLVRGLTAPPWRSPNLQPGTPAVLVVEGEMNGLAAYEVFYRRRERIGVLGMPGAESSLGEWAGWLAGKDVFIYADDDEPGRKARERWADEARRAGAVRVRQMPSLPGVKDYAEMLALVGTQKFATYLTENIHELEADPEPEPTPASTLGIRVLDLTEEPPPVRWVVSEMVQRGKINLLAAYGGVGKSALAAHLAVTVQAGTDFLERRTAPVSGILVIDYEDDDAAFKRWARRSAAGIGYPVDALNIHYVNAASDPAWKGRPLSEVVADLAVVLESEGGEWLIILDTFESAMQVDSIKAAEVLAAMSVLKKLTNEGHTVLALDHLPKLGRGQSRDDLMPIGSVQKTNQARSVIMLEDVTPEDYPENANLIKVRAVKLNAARRWEPFGVRREVGPDWVRYSIAPLPLPDTGRPPDKSEALKAAVLDVLRSGPMTKAELLDVAEGVEASISTLERVLRRLAVEGRIVRQGGHRGEAARYALPEHEGVAE